MPQYDYDYFVIGAGSGGVRSSRIAASHGAKVGVAEDLHMGGTCVNVGCVPKKLFSYAAHFAHDFEDAVGFGWEDIKHNFDWPTLVKNKNTEIERLNGIYRTMLGNAGVTIHDGRASFLDEHSLQVGDETVTADKILIAVGGWPSKPDYKGAEHGITSNEAFYLEKLPEKMVIVGGGYIAVEFACIFNALGVETHLLYRSELFMRGFDLDIRKTLAEEMEKQGIHLHFNTDITEVSKDGDTLTLSLTTDKTMECDCLFYAIGRHPKVEGLGLEKIGIETDKGNAIIVNDGYQTNIPHIYALGDVTNRINLTPVALAEGHVLADNLFNKTSRKVSYDNVASAVFSNPPIATVGLSEEQAVEKHGNITVFESRFRPMKYTLSGRDEKSYMKLIVDTETDKVLGYHMLGQDAPEIMQAIAIAMNMGATKADFDRTIGIHPTAAEEFVTLRTPRG